MREGSTPWTTNVHLLLAYVADLELEVDRLRKQGHYLHHEMWGALKKIQLLCAEGARAEKALLALGEIDHAAKELATVLSDLQEPPGYHPAHDQVITDFRYRNPAGEGRHCLLPVSRASGSHFGSSADGRQEDS